MNMLTNPTVTMSSREIAELTGKRHDQVLRTARELSAQGVTQSVETFYVHDQNGQQYPEHLLNKRDSLVLVARLSPEFTARIVDRWMELESVATRPLTTTETLIQMLTLQAEVERRQAKQGEQIAALNSEVSDIKRAHSVLEKMPTDCEGIERIRTRMNKDYGLSTPVVDKIMRDSPFAPTTRVLVRNPHAEGVHNSGFSKKEISAIFKRFVSECVHSAGHLHTHPYIEGRFKLAKAQ
ncbi:hypothetical protein ASF70_18785 [Rhizobium sp. Leaf321]|uniref:Rha family transcriptional regulator n=1 Tax=Rhizobium sp. Leaf321 TaxID=1736335 RepID=UPI0007136F2D|nr:Rha family transcriptional regulator [Rhizobium sp. Leaf321]KQQ70895.1 hypothetical protein ASF70_18785 [Rhizobium sp. Leaf321]